MKNENNTVESIETNAVFTYMLKKPIEYDGKMIESLNFDFDSLTGEDSMAIEAELESMGIRGAVAAASTPYLKIMSCKACKEGVGTDIFNLMSLKDFEAIKTKARLFLLN